MGDINRTTYFYRKKFESKEKEFNKHGPLPAYFEHLITPSVQKSGKLTIAEIAAGPINTIGTQWPGLEVEIRASDVFADEYRRFWAYHNKTPIIPIEYQNMEKLTYADNSFDIVHCVNSLDHTPDARAAIMECIRVCKKGGYIYFRHSPDQQKRYGGMHAWNVNFVDGQCQFSNQGDLFYLGSEFKVSLEGDLIVAICQKI